MDYIENTLKLKNKKDVDILKLYLIDKKTIKYICKEMHISDRYLYKLLKENNISKRQTKGMLLRKKIEDNKELLYYLIGLIASDGYLYEKKPRIEISLIKTDVALLKQISLLLYGEDKTIIQDNYSVNGRCRLFLYGREVVDLFKIYGIVQNKSSILSFNSTAFDQKYIWHFIRGYFDGDGSYYPNAGRLKHNVVLKVDGTYGATSFIKDICLKNDINASLFKINSVTSFDFYRFQISKTEDSIRFIKNTYNSATIYLERKYEKIKNVI